MPSKLLEISLVGLLAVLERYVLPLYVPFGKDFMEVHFYLWCGVITCYLVSEYITFLGKK